MSLPTPQIQLLRTAFQTCRPRSSLRLRGGSKTVLLLRQQQAIRHHSNDSAAPAATSNPHPSPSPSSSSSSVSQDEVSHFSRLASSWWDPYGPSRLLHLMNPLRHDFISTCLTSSPSHDPNTSKTYLDIGCGGGIFASSAARKPHTESVTAIDPTPEVIAVAKSHQRSDPALSAPKLTYLNCAIEDLPSQQSIPKQQYDIISLFEVIEHIDDPSSFLRTALTHLKPGGWLIGSTISRHPISYVTTKLIAEAPLIGVVPAGTHDWNKYLKPAELREWFEKESVQVEVRDGNWERQRTQHQELSLGQDQDHEKGSDEVDVPRHAFGPMKIEGVVYVPMLGWKFVKGSEEIGNYFFGVQKLE